MASTTLTPHGHRTGGGRTGQNTALRMSTSTKIIVGIVIVVVMALTSFWGVYAPSFSEAYILPVQMTAADGTPLGDFQCRPVPGENGKTLRQPSSPLPGTPASLSPPGKTACYGIVTERAQVSLYNRGNIVVL